MFMPNRDATLVVVSLILLTLGSANAKPEEGAALEGAAVETTEPGEATRLVVPHAALTWFLLQPVEDPDRLRGYRIAILAADGVDGFDLEVPRSFLSERGATVHVIVPRPLQVLQATGSGAIIKPKTQIMVLDPSGEEHAASFDRFVDQVRPHDYDIVYLPGNLARSGAVGEQLSVAFLQEAANTGKAIFAIGNSPLVLLKAGLLDRRRATGDPATLLSLASSAATGVNAPLVNDGAIYTSRDAFDMPVLMDRLVGTLLARPVRGQ